MFAVMDIDYLKASANFIIWQRQWERRFWKGEDGFHYRPDFRFCVEIQQVAWFEGLVASNVSLYKHEIR